MLFKAAPVGSWGVGGWVYPGCVVGDVVVGAAVAAGINLDHGDW